MNLRPHRALGPGRYVLDAAGRLHPQRRRHSVHAIAIVTVRALRQKSSWEPQDDPTADHAGGCEGRAAEVPNRPAAVRGGSPERIVPGNARQPRHLIDLSAVPSSMEQQAEGWRGNR